MDFKYGTGNLALDLVGTVGHRRSDVLELLATPADLVRFLAGTGLLDRPVPVSEADLAEAVSLREAVYRLARATIEGTPARPADRRALNELAAGPAVRLRLAEDGSTRRDGGLAEALAEIARTAVTLLGGPEAASVKECAAPDCTRLYVDRSRKQARRWCDMRSCGNRAKVAEFRARQKA
ncbi:ABATE domain-containing protein [Amycolatopsis sp. OK19-0408]|uniref:ABATE domain-containing protein n=1 Tax=Amycolatopsis iheyensis TaxID=2945988 RepID=A0A9X2NF27_9PSEU|nr:ABATE domain-containing protein [Amycolatopsis iheyensis]MCR6485645.1 ABATE domain-containing protein [Amycolatopsis iheyensis]